MGNNEGQNVLVEADNILVSASSYSNLKKTLIENIGLDKTSGFLFQFGYEIGISAANAKATSGNRDSQRGSKSMHAMYGHVEDVIINPNFQELLDGTLTHIKGEWIGSFEVKAHLKNFGVSKQCECFTLCGYVSGFLTTQYNYPLIAIETSCVSRGDDKCEFEVRLEENWEAEHTKVYQTANLLNELETTYDALYHHKQLLDRISTFHSNLTKSVTEKLSLKEIIQSAYDVLKIPIIVENLAGDEIIQIGLSEQQLEIVKQAQNELDYVQKYSNNSFYESANYSKLVSPVLINKKHFANCSFLYLEPQLIEENDHLYLDRISNVVSLCLLYENAQLEEQERLTYTLLDRLLNSKFKNKNDLASYLKFFPFKLEEPFSTAVIQITPNSSNKEKFIDLHEELLAFSKFFGAHKLPSLLSIIGENIVVLNTSYTDKEMFNKKLHSILKQVEKRNMKYHYSIGMSNKFDDLFKFNKSFEEATISEKITNQEKVKYYEDLGFIGHFIANMSLPEIHKIAKEMLNELYDFEDIRKNDLVHTLYKYLLNGQRLKETMEDLAISMGGLQYRIKQIETMLDRSLKDSSFASYLLLILEALILLDELNFK